MTADLLYKIKPLDHCKEIAGAHISCEWSHDLNTLVYDINSRRYRIIPGTKRQRIIDQVADTCLDFFPYASHNVHQVKELVDSALPEAIK